MKFKQYNQLSLPSTAEEILEKWRKEGTFARSLIERDGCPSFVFYEGPPSANGTPGIHHVMARTIKDMFCRYKTQQGFRVERKAGWDTHGLPVELGVEKKLGITKEDIGKKITIEQYNAECRAEVMKYTGQWRVLTEKMGYWVDMDSPYITYDNDYIETLWWMLGELFDKNLLYKGYTIQPYSPAAGTGLSNHELNQPGCYRDVKDTTCIAMFPVVGENNLYFLAWTTTPWTLPSNTALAVGPEISYVRVKTENPYSKQAIEVILAEPLLEKVMGKNEYEVVSRCKGKELAGMRYEQLMPWIKPMTDDARDAFRVITGDFVTTEDGTGIVHIAPTFGADDDRVAKQAGIAPMLLVDAAGKEQPMVDKTGKFFLVSELDAAYAAKYVTDDYKEWEGQFVKNAYDSSKTDADETLDVAICMWLKARGQVFKIEKHTHSYPHCWRTDKPVLYYPLDSWFIRTTALRERMIELNETINWKPASTGSGRFGKWLENLVDWNLSRSRYWGTPLPIWASEDRTEMICIRSVAQLRAEIEKSIAAGLMDKGFEINDLHRPYVDDVVLVSPSGQPMRRESDLIDVWFDSGAMPYAQQHFMGHGTCDKGLEDKSNGSARPLSPVPCPPNNFPADFIAEGVDQTRGWFFTLHALSVMLFDSVAFKNIISNGLVLDKNGNKMSKRLGNGVDPFEALSTYGADAVRWYMISNSQPWDNLKFDADGVDEVRRKFFGTLYNTYSFFALYANVDGFDAKAEPIEVAKRPEVDRWIISLLNSLIKDVTDSYENYDPTPAARAISDFVTENLSNWYVRLNRKRFWGGEMNADKQAAYQTLYECLITVAKLAAPIAPFITEQIFGDLGGDGSVHLSKFPEANEKLIDRKLEAQMDVAQRATSMVLALRRKVNIRVRQPLGKMIIPVLDPALRSNLEAVESLVKTEVNVKQIEYIEQTTGIITKRIKPIFPVLGKKHGALMKQIAAAVAAMSQEQIAELEATQRFALAVGGAEVVIDREDVEIISEDMPGWLVATEGTLTIALDVTISEELAEEGVAREIVNRVQNIRKDSGFEVTDRVVVTISRNAATDRAIERWADYIASQTLATKVELSDKAQAIEIEFDETRLTVTVEKA